MSKSMYHPRGYALLLGVMLVSFVVLIVLTVTTVVLRQTRFSARAVDAAQALAAADAGIERVLYADFIESQLVADSQQLFDSTTTPLPPFSNTASLLWYQVNATVQAGTLSTRLDAIGGSNASQRAIQLDY